MQNLLSSARLKDLSRRLGYTYSNFQSLWNDAVEEASDLGEGDNLGYILRILRELIGIPEREFQKATQNFIEQSYLSSSITDWNSFLESEGMIKSDIPQKDIPEVVNKKKPEEESWLKEAIEEEVISSFLQNIGLADKDKETSLKYLDTLQTYLVEPLETEDQKNLMSEFIDLLRKQIEETISEEERSKLVEYLSALFPDKKGEMTEDVLDQVNDVFGSAFGPIGSRLSDFFSLTKDVVSDIADAAGDDLDKIKDYLNDRKKEKESGESDGKDDTDSDAKTEPDFDLTDDAQKAKDQEKQDAKDLTPDEFHQKYGKCPKGYEFDSEKQACVKKEVNQKPAKKSSKKSSKKTPKKI